IIALAFRQRLLIVLLAAAIVGFGAWSLTVLPIDAVPDVTPTLVQIFTEAPGLAPEEVEQIITYPIEVSMNGLPDVQTIRSLTTFGLSVVGVYFKDGVDIYFARQLVSERLRSAVQEIPPGVSTPELGPITTGLGKIYQYKVVGDEYDLMSLRSLQDWVVKYHLRTVPGVTEVLSLGGHVKQYQVLVDPEKLISYDITLQQLFRAIEENNENVGASFIEKGSEEFVVRGIGRVQTV
ncbi:MAG: CusA/CzcA family heavy metal efflux RND transporter, partial [Anaerolineae bacterium]|nr:CusA/CzcA family heavy metal efflux RND transporter [Anaerolineae bacterium]NIN94375.1 CusA/CzcA family heavy metal efflux RND transporter [Anaerolineae bacterium]NIQ77441.1 CusA/CzcA family heavy metal efflux RND transporter [Anaerolineae bacterium]